MQNQKFIGLSVSALHKLATSNPKGDWKLEDINSDDPNSIEVVYTCTTTGNGSGTDHAFNKLALSEIKEKIKNLGGKYAGPVY